MTFQLREEYWQLKLRYSWKSVTNSWWWCLRIYAKGHKSRKSQFQMKAYLIKVTEHDSIIKIITRSFFIFIRLLIFRSKSKVHFQSNQLENTKYVVFSSSLLWKCTLDLERNISSRIRMKKLLVILFMTKLYVLRRTSLIKLVK